MASTVNRSVKLFQSNCIIGEATTKHSATILFLHGLGDTGDGWCHMLSEIKPPYAKLICPTAPTTPVSINGGMKMPSWFDIYTLDRGGKQDEEGIKAGAKDVHLAIKELEKEGIPSNRIVLGGFSQGGSLAIHAALTYPNPLAGLLCLSCWVPIHDKLINECVDANKQIMTLQCHGQIDPMVKLPFGQMTASFLSSLNPNNHKFITYPGLGHSAGEKELEDVKEWLGKLLPPVGGAM